MKVSKHLCFNVHVILHGNLPKCTCICARAVGGREGEKEERQKWLNRERKRIEDSVNGKCFS